MWMPDNSSFQRAVIGKSNQSHIPVIPILADVADRRPHGKSTLRNHLQVDKSVVSTDFTKILPWLSSFSLGASRPYRMSDFCDIYSKRDLIGTILSENRVARRQKIDRRES